MWAARRVDAYMWDIQYITNSEAAKEAREAAQEATDDDADAIIESSSEDHSDLELKGQDHEGVPRGGDRQESVFSDEADSAAFNEKEEEAPKQDTKEAGKEHRDDSIEAPSEGKRGVKHPRSDDENNGEEDEHGSNSGRDDDNPDAKRSKNNAGRRGKPDATGEKGGSDYAPGEQASATRLPAEGQNVHWRTINSWCEGTSALSELRFGWGMTSCRTSQAR